MKKSDRRNTDDGIRWSGEIPSGKRPWLAKAVFVLFCEETFFSVAYRSVYLFRQSVFQAWIAGLVAVGVISICFAFRRPILLAAGSFLRFPSIGNRVWLSFWLVFGLILRIAWMLRFPVPLQSDHLAYFQMATAMAKGQFGGGAYWPPGFALFLAPFFMVFGAHLWAVHFCALALFVATYLLAYALASHLQGGLASRIAPMLIAVWPGYLTLAGINCKEGLLAALLPATLFLYLKASDRRSLTSSPNAEQDYSGGRFRWGYAIASGLCMGFATLAQPGYLLFPSVIFGLEMISSKKILPAIGRTVVFSIALITAILPWTCRNYIDFHRIVLISTNGGSVFYRANNPLADANYSAEGEVPLPKDEFAADRQGYKMGEDWIVHHPGSFGELMIKKQVVFLGDDALGAYETMKRGFTRPSALYAPIKGVSNLFWLAAWIILFYGSTILFANDNWRRWYGLLFLPLIYQWAIDSVFESGPRHHVPDVALISVLVGIVLSSAAHNHKDTPAVDGPSISSR